MPAAAPIVVTALFGDGDNGWLQQLRRENYPPGLNRVPAHLTLFRHLPPSVEVELGRRLARAVASPGSTLFWMVTWGRQGAASCGVRRP